MAHCWVGAINLGWDMLIFQLHLLHVIPNSMQALHALSHSEITFRKAQFPYQHVSLKVSLMTGQLSRMRACSRHQLCSGKIYEMYSLRTSMLPVECLKQSPRTKQP